MGSYTMLRTSFLTLSLVTAIDVDFTRNEGESLVDFSTRILSIYNPDDYVARAECLGSTCKCLLPDKWQIDRFPSERTDLYFYFDKDTQPNIDCNEEMNMCHHGAPYRDWFTSAPRFRQDVIADGLLRHEQILRCMIRGWYYVQNDEFISKVMRNHLIAVHAKYDLEKTKKLNKKKKKK